MEHLQTSLDALNEYYGKPFAELFGIEQSYSLNITFALLLLQMLVGYFLLSFFTSTPQYGTTHKPKPSTTKKKPTKDNKPKARTATLICGANNAGKTQLLNYLTTK